MGAWHEREHKWINTAVLPKKSGLHDDYATGDQYGDGVIEQPTNPERDLDARHLIGILQVRRCASYLNPRSVI